MCQRVAGGALTHRTGRGEGVWSAAGSGPRPLCSSVAAPEVVVVAALGEVGLGAGPATGQLAVRGAEGVRRAAVQAHGDALEPGEPAPDRVAVEVGFAVVGASRGLAALEPQGSARRD